MGIAATLARWQEVETDFCRRANRWAMDGQYCWRYFAVASRLGDGGVWITLMLVLLCFGDPGRTATWQMAHAGLAGLVLYKLIKAGARRPRPLHADGAIVAAVAPLDHYSFPSGHTLHAVAFTVIAVTHLPWLAPLLLPLSLSIAASRVLLGLHYPTDVLCGALLGAGLAAVALTLPLPG